MASKERMIINSEKKTSELKLNQPKPFTGKRTKFDDFLQNIELYLDINEDIYNTDKKKIGYALSFMNEGAPNLGRDNSSGMPKDQPDWTLEPGHNF